MLDVMAIKRILWRIMRWKLIKILWDGNKILVSFQALEEKFSCFEAKLLRKKNFRCWNYEGKIGKLGVERKKGFKHRLSLKLIYGVKFCCCGV
ncbi:unnamed protein product [Blepharisma stoltei]|uniref:Uncharacterized protein n=1 Tax=Blepharisma stoltei TaxID=1481888 RepID=A0AAU9JQT0_9CILI|nr:unnamed protein product [Blepharisma stoltei]